MTAQIIDGRKVAQQLTHTVQTEISALPDGRMRGLLVSVAVEGNFASGVYQRRLERLAHEMTVPYRHHELPAETSEAALIRLITELGADPEVAAILLLRPFPAHISEANAFAALAPAKDVEAVHPENAGLLALGTPRYIPSTAAAAFHVLDPWLDQEGRDHSSFYENARIVVVGRSNNVGKPAVSLAYERRAAVTSIDEWSARGSRLGLHTRRADVLIVAAGVPGLITAEHIQPGAVVIDIGINPLTDPDTGRVRMVGDVDPGVMSRARAVTPVPGGIGPVTDVWLIRTAVEAELARLEGEERR